MDFNRRRCQFCGPQDGCATRLEPMCSGQAASDYRMAADTWTVPRKESLFLHLGFSGQTPRDTDLCAVLCQVRHDCRNRRLEDGEPDRKPSDLRAIFEQLTRPSREHLPTTNQHESNDKSRVGRGSRSKPANDAFVVERPVHQRPPRVHEPEEKSTHLTASRGRNNRRALLDRN